MNKRIVDLCLSGPEAINVAICDLTKKLKNNRFKKEYQSILYEGVLAFRSAELYLSQLESANSLLKNDTKSWVYESPENPPEVKIGPGLNHFHQDRIKSPADIHRHLTYFREVCQSFFAASIDEYRKDDSPLIEQKLLYDFCNSYASVLDQHELDNTAFLGRKDLLLLARPFNPKDIIQKQKCISACMRLSRCLVTRHKEENAGLFDLEPSTAPIVTEIDIIFAKSKGEGRKIKETDGRDSFYVTRAERLHCKEAYSIRQYRFSREGGRRTPTVTSLENHFKHTKDPRCAFNLATAYLGKLETTDAERAFIKGLKTQMDSETKEIAAELTETVTDHVNVEKGLHYLKLFKELTDVSLMDYEDLRYLLVKSNEYNLLDQPQTERYIDEAVDCLKSRYKFAYETSPHDEDRDFYEGAKDNVDVGTLELLNIVNRLQVEHTPAIKSLCKIALILEEPNKKPARTLLDLFWPNNKLQATLNNIRAAKSILSTLCNSGTLDEALDIQDFISAAEDNEVTCFPNPLIVFFNSVRYLKQEDNKDALLVCEKVLEKDHEFSELPAYDRELYEFWIKSLSAIKKNLQDGKTQVIPPIDILVESLAHFISNYGSDSYTDDDVASNNLWVHEKLKTRYPSYAQMYLIKALRVSPRYVIEKMGEDAISSIIDSGLTSVDCNHRDKEHAIQLKSALFEKDLNNITQSLEQVGWESKSKDPVIELYKVGKFQFKPSLLTDKEHEAIYLNNDNGEEIPRKILRRKAFIEQTLIDLAWCFSTGTIVNKDFDKARLYCLIYVAYDSSEVASSGVSIEGDIELPRYYSRLLYLEKSDGIVLHKHGADIKANNIFILGKREGLYECSGKLEQYLPSNTLEDPINKEYQKPFYTLDCAVPSYIYSKGLFRAGWIINEIHFQRSGFEIGMDRDETELSDSYLVEFYSKDEEEQLNMYGYPYPGYLPENTSMDEWIEDSLFTSFPPNLSAAGYFIKKIRHSIIINNQIISAGFGDGYWFMVRLADSIDKWISLNGNRIRKWISTVNEIMNDLLIENIEVILEIKRMCENQGLDPAQLCTKLEAQVDEIERILTQIRADERSLMKQSLNDLFFKPDALIAYGESLERSGDFSEAKRVYLKVSSLKLKRFDDSMKIKLENVGNKLLAEEKKDKELAIERAKRKATEDLMAMFAHKFRGPLRNVEYLSGHPKSPGTIKHPIETMKGLLSTFSIISTDPDALVGRIREERSYQEHNISFQLKEAIEFSLHQMLSIESMDKASQHYMMYAQRHGLVPGDINRQIWSEKYYRLQSELREKWEHDFFEMEGVESLEDFIKKFGDYFFPITLSGFKRSKIFFRQYGVLSTILLIILSELITNSIKYYSSGSCAAVSLDIEYNDSLTLTGSTPTTKLEQKIPKGSNKGHRLIEIIAENIGGEFLTESIESDDRLFTFKLSLPGHLFN